MLKKLNCLVLLIGISSSLFAQIPTGYYDSATGTGYTLKTQLYNIIKDHTNLGYSGLWTTYQTSDRDYYYENDGTILDMYSENASGTDPYNFTYSTDQCGTYSSEGDCYNREHIIPQSIFNEASPMVADAHFITPTDGKVNGMRSNYPHGVVGTATYTSQNGSKLGSASNSGYAAGYSGTVFEPIDEFKGDIARMYFYFATRYQNVITTWGTSYAMFNGTTDQVFAEPFLTILLTWNALDPVSASEVARNNAIYARQNNRNPFIDHPEYVNQIWSTSSDTQAPTAPTNLAASSVAQTTLTLGWTASTDNVGVTGYDIYKNGTLLASATTTSYSVTGLTAGTSYTFYVKAKDAAGNVSSASSSISVTTTASTSDTQAPTAPTNLATSSVAQTSLTLSWTASTDNVGVTGYDIYKNGTLLATSTTTSYSVTGLTASTSYSFYVKAKDAAGNVSSASSTVSATTSAATVTYCTSKGSNYSYEWIASVTVGSLTNSSSAAGYTDFTSKTFNATAGSSYSVSLVPGFASSTYSEYWKIWIDLNGDGDFDDTNENVFDAGATSKTTVTGTLTIPSGTAAISTRMRVSMKYNGSQTACETFSYGEVEDYTVVITGGSTADTQTPTAPTNLTASNIAQTSATISWTASTDNVGVTGYNIYKNGTLLTTTTSTSYSLSGLTASTSYTIAVSAFDASSNVSTQASTTFTTLTESSTTSMETFDNFSAGTSYVSGTFTGQDGSTWTYSGCRGDISITGSSITLGKGKTPLSYVTSGTILGGIGTLTFDYMQAFSTAANFYVYVNNVLVKTATSSTANSVVNSGSISVNVSGSFTLKFVQVNTSSGQVAIDNIEWTQYSTTLKTSASDGITNTNENEFTLYPNPASDFITIGANNCSNMKYSIVDITGKVIANGDLNNSKQISISSLVKGLYFVKITDDKGANHTMKFLKQ
ncbi:MAG: endonuclease [Bacteroidales bacterium]